MFENLIMLITALITAAMFSACFTAGVTIGMRERKYKNKNANVFRNKEITEEEIYERQQMQRELENFMNYTGKPQ